MKKNHFVFLFAAILILVVLVYFFFPGKGSSPSRQPNVIVLTIDTLRADHLGCYGYSLETSPTIDRMAAQGIRFTDCTVQWPNTPRSMSSFIAGVYPRIKGSPAIVTRVPPSLTLLSDVFKKGGYSTGAIVSNVNVRGNLGFSKGFDLFVESWNENLKKDKDRTGLERKSGWVKEYTNATLVVDQCLEMIEKMQKDKPFFLWLHFMDPHGPYVPPEKYLTYFDGDHPPEPAALKKLPDYQLLKEAGSGKAITDLAYYKTQYDREIRYTDDEIGRLLRVLKERGLKKDTLFVVSADHGESFGEHEYYLSHGKFSYQACANVPLIFVQEGVLEANRVLTTPVGLIDVSATLLDLAGLQIPEAFEGKSLKNLLLEGEEEETPPYVFMEAGPTPGKRQQTVRSGKWKLIHVQAETDRNAMTGAEYELYDVEADPSEIKNVAAAHPDIVQRLKSVLKNWDSKSGFELSKKGIESKPVALDAQSEKMLRALGYIE